MKKAEGKSKQDDGRSLFTCWGNNKKAALSFLLKGEIGKEKEFSGTLCSGVCKKEAPLCFLLFYNIIK